MRQRISNSKWDRAAECSSAFVVDGAIPESGEDADIGKAVHSFLQVSVPDPHLREEALDQVPPSIRPRCDAIDLGAIHRLVAGNDKLFAEWGFDYHPDTGTRFLGCGLDRKYPDDRPEAIPGTLDLVGVFEDRGVVADYKSGHSTLAARDARQLKMGAVAVSDEFGVDIVETYLVYVDDDGGIWTSHHTMDALAIEEAREESRQIIASIPVAEANVDDYFRIGGHCNYCEVRHVCGAQSRVALALIETSGSLEAATPEELGQLYEISRAIGSALRKTDAFLKKRAETPGAIVFEDGSTLEMVSKEKDAIVVDKALRVVSERYGPEGVLRAASVSKASLERAIPPDPSTGKAPRGEKPALLRAVKAAGGFKKIPTLKLEKVNRR